MSVAAFSWEQKVLLVSAGGQGCGEAFKVQDSPTPMTKNDLTPNVNSAEGEKLD